MHKILALSLTLLVFILGFFYAKEGLAKFYEKLIISLKNSPFQMTPSEGCGKECKKAVQEEVEKAMASISASVKRTSTPKSTDGAIALIKQTSFISLNSDYSTTSTSWVDVPGSDISLDLAADYSKNAKVSWDASLKVANANGTSYARLFDATHGIAVDGSEISLTNSDAFQRVTSKDISLWSGRNTYKVQLKSLNSFEVFITASRMKIYY